MSIKSLYRREGAFQVFKSGYRVSVPLVRYACFVVLLYVVFAAFVILSNPKYYVYNSSDVEIENPFLGSSIVPVELSSMEFLPPGFESGVKHPWFIDSAPQFALLFLLLAGILNHFRFNLEYMAHAWE